MQGIVSEMQEDLEEFGETSAADAVLIGCAQVIEHYEIARYGLLKTWAGQLGYAEAVTLLDETLQEEKATDAKLSQIAEGQVNAKGETAEPVKASAKKAEATEAPAKTAKKSSKKK